MTTEENNESKESTELGVCDVCGEPTKIMIRNYSERIGLDEVTYRKPEGGVLRFCKKHKKEAVCVKKTDERLGECE